MSDERKDVDCPFCDALSCAEDGPQNLVVHREERAALILNKFPYNNGHCMVIPTRHVVEPSEMSAAESAAVWGLVSRTADLLRDPLRAHGVNVGVNLGSASGGSIRHLHVHLVPRWQGDTNFMPVIGETKVMVEMNAETYARFRDALARQPGAPSQPGEPGGRGDGAA